MVNITNNHKEAELELPYGYDTGVETEGEDEDDNPIIEPFDPTLIRVATLTATVDLLISRLKNKEIDLAPGFQRKGGIWTDKAQSRLIESLLIKIPLPAFYMDATDDDKWLVVDGLQRLTALKRFVIEQTLQLSGMEFLYQLNGKTFDQLPRALQRRILETQVTVYQIEKGTPSGVKFNIFKRINTGGMPLSAQEIRHALNQGPVTDFLMTLASSEEYKRATSNSIRSDRMADREFALRFLAFALSPPSEYKAKDFDSFLNDTMKTLNHSPSQKREELNQRFRRSMQGAHDIFGKYAFRKRTDSRIQPINKPLFEACSVCIDALSDQQLKDVVHRKSKVEEKMILLLQDTDFNNAISLSTGDVRKIRLRFSAIGNLFAEVLK